jgi:cell division protein FtsL
MKILAGLAGLCLVFVFVWERVDIVRVGYQIERLKVEKVKLERERDRLRVKFSTLTAPDRIAKVATEQLGMTPPQNGQVIVVQARSASAPFFRAAPANLRTVPVEVRVASNVSFGGRE